MKEKEIRVKLSKEKFELVKKWADKFDSKLGSFGLHLIMEKINELEAKEKKGGD
jgi:hypothetical protein